MRRRRNASRRPVTVVLMLLGIVGGGALLRRRGALPAIPGLDRLPGRAPAAKPGSEDFTCECWAQYRRTGLDRHRVYWPAGAGESEAVLGTDCVQCGRPLPA